MASSPPPLDLNRMLGEAVALHQQGRLDEAEKLYGRVLKAQRDNFDALHLLGMLQHQRHKAGEAHRLIAAALKVDPRSADALSNMAMALHALKRDSEALVSLDKALSLAPGHRDALNNRGTLLLDLGRPAEALAMFEKLLAAEPRHVQARLNRGNALAALGRHDAALADYDSVLAAQPGHPLALYNRGNALRALGRDAEALGSFDRALSVLPRHIGALNNRGLALQAMNRHREAAASFQAVLALSPDHADAHFNLATALLTLGDYRSGLPHYEWRWRRSGMNAKPRFREPLWLGETPLAGKTILLHAEQGLGDSIQFARYAPLLARAGARVVLEVQPELKALMAGLAGIAAVLGRGETLPKFDVQCPLASLPLACKTEVASIPADVPYLAAEEGRVAQWRERLAGLSPPRVALVWSGRATHPNDANRSIAFSDLAPLFAVPGVRYVGLQREIRDGDTAAMNAAAIRRDTGTIQRDTGAISDGSVFVSHGENLADFADTAAVISLCDLVVCVDTSVAHAAGALGRPAFILLPFQPDWRWLLDRDSTPWYPQARLFRQPRPRDWGSVIANVRDAIAARFG